MPSLVILVLDDVDKLPAVLEAWQRLGASGVTIFESSGLARLAAQYGRDDVPLFPDLLDLLREREVRHRTLFSVVGDELDLVAFFDATEAITGPMEEPGSGILLAVPVLAVRGLSRRSGPMERG